MPQSNGPGGWAIRVWDGETAADYSGKVPKISSSNALELITAFQIFKTVPKDAELQIFCPGDYVYKGMTQWIDGWKRRGWKTASGSPVKHADSWRSIDDAASNRRVQWVLEDRDQSPAVADGLDQVARDRLS
ncbi:MAG: hypothetical protein L0154_19175 [Chloroflexi bacterium]|nr:hypothetical protein [Chloroflexota bacterium]